MTKEDFDYWKAQDPLGFACSNGAEKHYGGAY